MPKQPQATLLASAALALALTTGGLSPTGCFAAAQPARLARRARGIQVFSPVTT